VFIDCTASEEVAAEHGRLLAAGISVVTANKVRLAGPREGYRSLVGPSPARLYYETTVGAGLPVVRTLTDLLATGDRLHRLEGLFSGTLTYLMDRLTAGEPFSRALRQAYDLGLTEPDPREDLSGRDVARKLLILGRLAGRDLEPEEVEVEPLLPPDPWNGLSLEALWQRLPEVDEAFARRAREAAAAGLRLVYLGSLGEDRLEARLAEVPLDHPCARVSGTDNLIALTTDRYRQTPMVIQGPGAGPEVTAAGVFTDLLRAVSERSQKAIPPPEPSR
ncbi:MAG: bifunctional aspartate kinase/homoserine dehydrogenase I, partial [Acidobacteria bacterium]|nr:bifunctional aspartate kinase/homoserine dehydrogenase I [Acidobacteriota bacterium]